MNWQNALHKNDDKKPEKVEDILGMELLEVLKVHSTNQLQEMLHDDWKELNDCFRVGAYKAKGGTMHNVEYATQQKKPIFCPDVGNEVIDVQTGTKKLIDENTATVIKQGRDIKGVLDAVGFKNVNTGMRNIDIKKIFLHSVLSILNSESVLDATIQELKLPLQKNSSFYENAVKLINSNTVDIDTLLNSLILNNIASINKTLKFND